MSQQQQFEKPPVPYGCVCMWAQSCLTPCNIMDYSLPGSYVHGILQARILDWVAISCSRGSSWARDRTCIFCISCIGRHILYHWTTWNAPPSPYPQTMKKKKEKIWFATWSLHGETHQWTSCAHTHRFQSAYWVLTFKHEYTAQN